MEPKWQSIETAPTDFTVFMVAWPHSQMDGGWFFDFWAGKHLLDVRKAYDEGLDKLSPHMWQMPTHWQPLPVAPDATNTHPPATDVAALVENGCEMPEVAAMRYIEELRSDLAASVTILCDNEEAWTKDEQMAVEVIAEWTDWIAKRFMGESVIQCLARAIGARRQALAALKDRTHG